LRTWTRAYPPGGAAFRWKEGVPAKINGYDTFIGSDGFDSRRAVGAAIRLWTMKPIASQNDQRISGHRRRLPDELGLSRGNPVTEIRARPCNHRDTVRRPAAPIP
jgi:hypothetical protein